ncbi:FKBP-type peptidyl-prolyl cis-trans isomerase [Geopsychrobacter electrodiphilus]|uniref:FKBP-type peptidyl-prolyl cis-trans isomerase N-terminal domain-containing protein n=1 Tax=Geopsychrobacter electrodiphilus TaxID=225196 RepID=UPI000378A709|nr:FKBP-type peptidyl-prolyl cis-trans isomerase [Geopsychrobacter electrodiphilus]
MRIRLLLTAALVIVLPFNLLAEDFVLKDAMDKINYSVGHQIGGDFKDQGVDMRSDALLQGIRDAIQSNKPPMTQGEMRQVLLDLKKMVIEGEKAKQEKYRGEGRDFLKANAAKEGIISLPSGLQYKVLQVGTGPVPTAGDSVKVNYLGTRLDGREFDSTSRRGGPEVISLSKVIPGWKEALTLMPVGSKWQLFIPADLAYGERGPLAEQTVIFEVELLAIDKS